MKSEILQSFVDYVYELVTAQRINEVHIVEDCSENWMHADPHKHLYVEEGHLGVPANILKSAYQLLYNDTKTSNSECFEGLAANTFILLFLNPNLTVFWNRRKMLCLQRQRYQEEDVVSAVLLLAHPKCSAVYEHRRWLLQQGEVRTERKLTKELSLCSLTAERYPNNYYSWSHRQWCLLLLSRPKAYKSDLELIRRWRERNVSQYCAFNHCQFLLRNLSVGLDELMFEYREIVELIDCYPGHKSLWSHRKWVVLHLSLQTDSSCRYITERELELKGNDDYHISRYRKGLKLLLC